MRIDKWLCYVRIFKTRMLASEACRGNSVKIDGNSVKPSRELCPGDVISIEQDIAVRKTRVIQFPKQRVSPKVVDYYREDLTSETPPRDKFDFLNEPMLKRAAGSGRPTKKERRQLQALLKIRDD